MTPSRRRWATGRRKPPLGSVATLRTSNLSTSPATLAMSLESTLKTCSQRALDRPRPTRSRESLLNKRIGSKPPMPVISRNLSSDGSMSPLNEPVLRRRINLSTMSTLVIREESLNQHSPCTRSLYQLLRSSCSLSRRRSTCSQPQDTLDSSLNTE